MWQLPEERITPAAAVSIPSAPWASGVLQDKLPPTPAGAQAKPNNVAAHMTRHIHLPDKSMYSTCCCHHTPTCPQPANLQPSSWLPTCCLARHCSALTTTATSARQHLLTPSCLGPGAAGQSTQNLQPSPWLPTPSHHPASSAAPDQPTQHLQPSAGLPTCCLACHSSARCKHCHRSQAASQGLQRPHGCCCFWLLGWALTSPEAHKWATVPAAWDAPPANSGPWHQVAPSPCAHS